MTERKAIAAYAIWTLLTIAVALLLGGCGSRTLPCDCRTTPAPPAELLTPLPPLPAIPSDLPRPRT